MSTQFVSVDCPACGAAVVAATDGAADGLTGEDTSCEDCGRRVGVYAF